MKAIICEHYGIPDVYLLKEVEKPAPKENGVLVKIFAASVNPLDLQIKGGMARIYGGFSKPKDPRLGRDIAGRVEAIGSNVTTFKPGDEVFGVCGGAFAEYAATNMANIALKPANLTFEEAAAVPVAASTALQGLRDKGQIKAGQKVLINGAGGGVGSFAVQIAKSFGTEVTAVCSAKNGDMARSIGADHVIDYSKEDFTKSGHHYDLIFAVNGYHSLSAYRRALTPQGIYTAAGGTFPQILQALLLGSLFSKAGGQKMGFMGIANINPQDMNLLKEHIEAGKIKPVIDKRYPLSETAAALRYLSEKHARGKVVIIVEQN